MTMGLFRATIANTVSAVALLAMAVPAQAQQAAQQDYALPVQSLGRSLRAVALASGTNIIAATTLIAGKSAPALAGRFTPADAVAMLLRGSGLRARASGASLVVEPDTPIAQNGDAGDSGTAGADIVVTGSRIRGASIASPVIRLSQEAMRNAGQASLGEVVRSIPQSFGGGQNPGIGNNVPSAGGVDVGGGSSINLRGIGSDATLTLLNGHRLSYNGSRQSIDVSSIPLGAVRRIEIVPDGASALYGSDAVAGVANVVLKPDFDGVETSAQLGASTDGGDFAQRYGLVAGQRWSTGGFIASYEFARSTPIYGRDRSYAEAQSPTVTLFPSLKSHSAVLSAHQAISPTLTFDVDGLYNKRFTATSFADNATGDISVSGNRSSFVAESFAVAPTLRLSLGSDWRLFTAGSYGRDHTRFTVVTITDSVADVAPNNCYCNSAWSAEIGGDGTVFQVPAGSAKVALGAGYRSNAFIRSIGSDSAQNVTRSQNSYFGYAEVSLPLLSPAQGIGFVDRLEASAALRYENYPGIGDIVTPKMGLIYAPSADFDVKGSWGKSFRAPTLLQQFQAREVLLIPPSIFGGSGYPAGSTALYVQGGNPGLKPERATTWSATIDLHPRALSGTSLALSYFKIAYRDRIVTPIQFLSQSLSNPNYRDRLTFAPDQAQLADIVASALEFTNITGASYDPASVAVLIDNSNVNAGHQSIHGVDALFSYHGKLGPRSGDIGATIDASYLASDQQISSAQPVLPLAGIIFNPPHFRGRGGLSWDDGPLTLTSTLSYVGGVRDTRSAPSAHIGSLTTLDLTGRYRTTGGGLFGGLDLSLSLLNIFNAKPRQIATILFSDTPYDSTNYSPVGRFVSVRIAKTW